jgi:ParB-like chromosome segregation protein Spo0J
MGSSFPPIEVYAWQGTYYVLDGHHRVAAARAAGSDFIDVHVIEVSRFPHTGCRGCDSRV